MKTAEIRSAFIKFFADRQHTIVPSSPLVPEHDQTLLFTNAGMVQFKDVFTGRENRPYTRAASVQKCVRAGGKHNDLENVGFTARHHTFFEMLGNFSFGDYFKEQAITYAWELVTSVLQLSKDVLYVTVYKDDDESFALWRDKVGVDPKRISRFGEKDNFWSMGDTGPCGPCTEIFADRGEKYGCKKSDCAVGCDCDRYVEIWNLVFMQFERHADGSMTPLPKPSVDTGAGLERLACVLQKADSNYDTDTFVEIMQKTSRLLGKPYQPGTNDAFSFRVIADHSRAIAFLISDGVMPANEGRGYVLRRIIRRAVRYGRKLGAKEPFLYKTCQFVIDQMKGAYPGLSDKRSLIEKLVYGEEEQFLKTLERGLSLIEEEMAKVKKGGTLPGEVAFKLYDTYGFPVDLTRVICHENGLMVDEAGFEKAMAGQRSQSRKSWKGSGEEAVSDIYFALAEKLREKKLSQKFVGYEDLSARGKCLGIIAGGRLVDFYTSRPGTKDEIEAVFDITPFYGESGGQAGDQGEVSGAGFLADVIDVQKPTGDLIVTRMIPKQGSLKVGGEYLQDTNAEIRRLTMRNHTATHLLHWALRQVLGSHVKQAGSLVNHKLLRFDFSHYQGMTPEEVRKVEEMINRKIWQSEAVAKKEMAKDEAIAAGAIAFFGEKYGDTVRVVSVGDYSVELCGGTHVDNTADIHLFKIVTEASIASGVRRIVAYTSKEAYEYLHQADEELNALRDRFKAANREQLEQKLEKLITTEKELRREIDELRSAQMGGEVDELLKSAKKIGNAHLITHLCAFDASGMKKLREMGDKIREKDANAVVVLGMKDEEGGKVFLLAAVGQNHAKTVGANMLIQTLSPHIEGRGGGKPELAQAGGTNLAGLVKALSEAESLVAAKVKG